MILVTGGTGQVGRAVKKSLASQEKSFDAPTRSSLNLDDPKSIELFLQGKNYESVIHLAAETNVDLCETDPQAAIRRNLESTKVLANFAKEARAQFIFVSSAGVVSANPNLMHLEDEKANPCNAYASSKAAAEDYINANLTNFLIIRAAWMLGKSANVKKFAEIMVDKIRAGDPVTAVYDKFGSITSSTRLADLIVANLGKDFADTVHVGSNTPCSRYDVAKEIAWRYGSGQVSPVPSSAFQLAAPRGFSEGLDSSRASELLGYVSFKWEKELEFFLGELD